MATNLRAELQGIGLDLAKLPPLSKLEGDKLRKVMKLFNRSLGTKCSDCHKTDYSAPTPKKFIAERMWDEFVRGYVRAADGEPLFCDSCHQGKAKFLEKGDKKALGAWMEDHFEHGLKRRDETAVSCASCHGDPFEGDILDVWAKGPTKKTSHR